MSITVHQFPCLEDNYGYLVRDNASGQVACIDTPDVARILEELARLKWPLHHILNTHWHPDHAGGNEAVRAATGCTVTGPQEVVRVTPVDRLVAGGDVFQFGNQRVEVIDVGGHTQGHIAYYLSNEQAAFVGDALFTMGCGRLFEGTPEQMWASLGRLVALPPQTVVYCAHEYTAGNARFAVSLDDDPAVRARAESVFAARARGEPTVPTTIAQEVATNPFLRAPLLAKRARLPHASDAEAFGAVRLAKDNFKG
jgi:hydroxyacylglutathione hydrolase